MDFRRAKKKIKVEFFFHMPDTGPPPETVYLEAANRKKEPVTLLSTFFISVFDGKEHILDPIQIKPCLPVTLAKGETCLVQFKYSDLEESVDHGQEGVVEFKFISRLLLSFIIKTS